MDLDLVSFLPLVHLTSETFRWFLVLLIFFFLIYFQLECLWLFPPTSSSKPGVLLLLWSVGRSAGWACSLWGCCSATLWWDACCVSHVTLNNPCTSGSLCFIIFNTIWFHVCPHTGWTRAVLLPDFRGLLRFQCSISAIFCPRDQRKDNGRDHGGLQQTELQEQGRWRRKHRHQSCN